MMKGRAYQAPKPWINPWPKPRVGQTKKNRTGTPRQASPHWPKRLILAVNLLPWYDELEDRIEVEDPGFPKSVLQKIAEFGDFEIEKIHHKQTTLLQRANSSAPDHFLSAEAGITASDTHTDEEIIPNP